MSKASTKQSDVGEWYVTERRRADGKIPPMYIISRRERGTVRHYDSISHISIDDGWPATWFRVRSLADACCAALNALPAKDRVKPSKGVKQ